MLLVVVIVDKFKIVLDVFCFLKFDIVFEFVQFKLYYRMVDIVFVVVFSKDVGCRFFFVMYCELFGRFGNEYGVNDDVYGREKLKVEWDLECSGVFGFVVGVCDVQGEN